MGLTSADVMKAVQAQNKQSAIGSIGAEPSSDKPAFVFSLTTQGRLVGEDEFNDIVVRTGESGAVVRVRDVGRAEAPEHPRDVDALAADLERFRARALRAAGLPGLEVQGALREEVAGEREDQRGGIHRGSR